MTIYATLRRRGDKVFLEIPSDNTGRFADMQEQATVAISFETIRDIDTHKRYFEVLNLFCDNAPTPVLASILGMTLSEFKKVDVKAVIELVRKAIEIEAGYCELVKYDLTTVDGEGFEAVRKQAKSIKFGEMKEDEFRALHSFQKRFMFDALLESGWSEADLQKLFGDFYKFSGDLN